MVDFILTESQIALQELCKDFGQRFLEPIADELDRNAAEDPAGCFPWNALREFSSLGLKNLPLPEKWGGADMGVLTHCVLLEELMATEAGFAAVIHQTWKLAGLLLECGTEEQIAKYFSMLSEDDACLIADGTLGPIAPLDALRLSAVREGSAWVLDGRKRFVASGPIARLFVIEAGQNGLSPDSGETATFIVYKDTPGFRIGKVHDKMGGRILVESELEFKKCRVPEENELPDSGGNGAGAKSHYFGRITPTIGAFGVGIARSALEKAIVHALERVQGGKPILDHDIVAFRLAEMKVNVEVARALVWKAAWHSDHRTDHDPRLGLTAVLFASEMAPRVCDAAIQVFGGYGYMRDYPVQRYWRDALMCLFHGGTHDTTRLKLGRLLEVEHI